MRNNGVLISNLIYIPINPVAQTSNFSVSSLAMNDFNTYSLTIKNNTLSTKSYAPVITGANASLYTIVLNRCSSIAPKGNCQISVRLSRSFAGSYSATLSEPQVSGSVSLSSLITNATVGVIPPPVFSISVTPNPVNFGTITTLGQSGSQTVTITNTGNSNAAPVVSVEGAGLSIGLNRCQSYIAPTKSCTVTLYFNALNVMFNGVQSGLNFLAKATNASSTVTTPVSVTLNIPPSLLTSTTPSVTNPTYLNGPLSAGSYRTVRISPSGTIYSTGGFDVYGSGNNGFGTVGYFPTLDPFKFVSSSKNSDYFCGITTTNITYCTDSFGMSYSYYSPDMTGLAGQYFKEVYPGFLEFDYCGLTNLNKVYCWGNNDYGNAGTGDPIPSSATFDFSNIPAEIKMTGALAGKTIKKLSTIVLSKCVIASDDKPYCWGYNDNGELGTGNTVSVSEPTQVKMTGALAGKTVKDISGGSNGFCVIASDEKVYCWGVSSGLFTNTSNTTDSTEPILLVDTNNVLSGKVLNKISVGGTNVCVIANDNKIYCWGGNLQGQLGRGTTSVMSPPALVDMLNFAGKTPNDLSVGFQHACATTTDDSLFCWGNNDYRQLSISTPGNQLSPILIPNGY